MALINCPECNKEISDKAESCPNCGYNLKKHFVEEKKTSDGYKKKKLIILIAIVVCVLVSIFVLIPKKPRTIEDQVYSYMKEIQEKYGKVSLDCVYTYCDGETQTMIIHYYGTGKYNDNMKNTFVYYTKDKNGEVKVSDPNGDVDSVSVAFMEFVRYAIEEEYDAYRDKEQFITYNEFNQFKEGCIEERFFQDVNERIKEEYKE